MATRTASTASSHHPPAASAKKAAPPKKSPVPDPKVQEAMTPGPEHAKLTKSVGTWKVAYACWMQEGQEPVRSSGRSVITSVFDGRYTRDEFTGDFDGKPFSGVGTMGFDRAAKRYQYVWYDSMGTSIVCTSGTASGPDGEIELHGSMTCPIRGQMTLRQVFSHEKDGRYTLTMYNTVDGKETRSMELTYTRETREK